MPKCWSISTTIRNPERNIPFLNVLSEFEGQVFNEGIQSAFFKRLIQTKNYQPMNLPKHIKDKYEDPEEFTDEELEELLSNVTYENAEYNNDQEQIYAMRGRTAVGNLNKMSMVIARQAIGTVQLSALGRAFISEIPNFSNIFLRYCLKWQLSNPAERGYKGFNINPFISTLHVIDKVNELWTDKGNEPVGISKVEFSLFIPTLTHYENINIIAQNIIKFREKVRSLNRNDSKTYIDNFARKVAIETFDLEEDNEKEIVKKVENLYDYGDSAIRYFRQTGLLIYRGNGRYVDFAVTRKVEIRKILDTYDGSALSFDDLESYLDYMADINQPVLPWENFEDLKKVYENLLVTAIELQEKIKSNYKGQELHNFALNKQELNNVSEYNTAIEKLRDIIKILNVDLSILEERSLINLSDYMKELNTLATRRKANTGQDPLNLEWYTALTLMALDDAKEIKPNYVVGDDNIPVFTAQGNTPDIECYYEDFNIVCEVTLLQRRDQWVSEGQPVMRHFRDFEDKQLDKDNYCLFIAPSIHRDTLNTFWMGVKLAYEGRKQKIIPITINQYLKILQIVIDKKNDSNYRVNRINIKDLLDSIYNASEKYIDSNLWFEEIDKIIDGWGLSLVA